MNQLRNKQLLYPLSGSFTGSLSGTASFAISTSYSAQNLSSSYAITSSYAVFANDYLFTSSLLEYYVDRRFSGSCEVTILANKTISSSNAAYLTQLSASRVGDPNHPWPDPWSANLRASASIASGQSPYAKIIIRSGNTYTYGSSVLTQNGDITGSTTNNTRPDIAVSQSVYNLRAFDLISPNIEYYFEQSASLYNINKSWRQELVIYTSSYTASASEWNANPIFKITGQGKFVGVYGQSSGYNFAWGTIYYPRAEITIQADHIIQNMWNGWQVGGQKVNVDVNKWWSYSATFLNTSVARFNWVSQSLVNPSLSLGIPITNININELRWGENQFGGIAPHAADYWGGMYVGNVFESVYNVNINKITARTRFTDGLIRWDPVSGAFPTCSNNTININIGYISGSRTSIGGPILKIARYNAADIRYENSYYKIHVDKFDAWGIGFGDSNSLSNISNCTVIFSCNDYRNYLIPNFGENSCVRTALTFFPTSSAPGPQTGSFTNNQVIVTGNYRNYAADCPLVGWACGNHFNTNDTSYNTLILDNFKGYQLATQSSAPVINVHNVIYTYSTGSYIVVKDSLLYTSGSTLIGNSTGRIPNFIFNSTITNRDLPSNINAEGTFNISSNLGKLIY